MTEEIKHYQKRGLKPKTIASIIDNKIKDWINSLPENIRQQVYESVIVTGGCIPSMLQGDKPNDFDVYFNSRETTLLMATHYVNVFNSNNKLKSRHGECRDITVDATDPTRIKIIVKSAGVSGKVDEDAEPYAYFEGDETPDRAEKFISENIPNMPSDEETKEFIKSAEENIDSAAKKDKEGIKYQPIMITNNAITLWGKVQLITRFYGPPEEIHKHYDFVHVLNYWTPQEGLVLNVDALSSLLCKELIYRGSLYPICSAIRTRKFIQRGWTCHAGQYLKMAFQISELDLNNFGVLEDQLTGVDAAYFDQLISAVKAEKEKNKDFKVDATYIAMLIDKLM